MADIESETLLKPGEDKAATQASFWKLTLGSIGVVYGDIGTSPLYALRESVLAATGPTQPVTEPIVLGILSLIIWALFLVVTAKYVIVLLRADNHGEGGTLALMALANRATGGYTGPIILLGIRQRRVVLWRRNDYARAIGAFGGGRPEDRRPGFRKLYHSAHCRHSHGPFCGQVARTSGIATFFGPIMLVWFFVIAAAGL